MQVRFNPHAQLSFSDELVREMCTTRWRLRTLYVDGDHARDHALAQCTSANRAAFLQGRSQRHEFQPPASTLMFLVFKNICNAVQLSGCTELERVYVVTDGGWIDRVHLDACTSIVLMPQMHLITLCVVGNPVALRMRADGAWEKIYSPLFTPGLNLMPVTQCVRECMQNANCCVLAARDVVQCLFMMYAADTTHAPFASLVHLSIDASAPTVYTTDRRTWMRPASDVRTNAFLCLMGGATVRCRCGLCDGTEFTMLPYECLRDDASSPTTPVPFDARTLLHQRMQQNLVKHPPHAQTVIISKTTQTTGLTPLLSAAVAMSKQSAWRIGWREVIDALCIAVDT